MNTILVINSKGGSGKTTVATNLAAYFAGKNFATTIMDYDPQGSSMHWLKSRPPNLPEIHGANAARQKGNLLRSWQMAIPKDTEFLIIDSPAGVDGLLLQEMVRKSDFIIIPVAPSSIDIHAVAHFVKDLFLEGQIRENKTKAGVVANRVYNSEFAYEPLEQFLHKLELPFLTRLSDSQNYILAADQGMGIFEMDYKNTIKERKEFQPILNWLGLNTNHARKNATDVIQLYRKKAYRLVMNQNS